MNIRQKVLYTAITAVFLVFTAFLLSASAQDSDVVRLGGSRYMYFGVTDMARVYTDHNPQSKIVVKDSEIHSALPALLKKKIDALMVLGGLDDDAKSDIKKAGADLTEQIIGWGGIVLITDPKNPVKSLTLDQVRKIFEEEIRNWKEVGGLDEPIVVMSRDDSVSGTEYYFRDAVLNGMPMAQQTVKVLEHNIVNPVWKQKGSIADARFTEAVRARIDGKVHVIALRESADSPAIFPSADTIRNHSYPLSVPLVLYYNARSSAPALKEFVGFCARRGLGPFYADVKAHEIR
jgi:phosphate transport system substrate-binding protein